MRARGRGAACRRKGWEQEGGRGLETVGHSARDANRSTMPSSDSTAGAAEEPDSETERGRGEGEREGVDAGEFGS